jgi:hypothetical protein
LPSKPNDKDPLEREVDRLLRQLPGADPSLQSDPDEPPPSPPRPQAMGPLVTGPRPAVPPLPRPSGPTATQRLGVWGRAAAGALLGVALTQWPYRDNCGWPLYGYLAAVAVLLIVAGWAAVTAWRFRIGAAHAVALVVGFWGVVLAAEQILPRIGYAAEARTWGCRVAPAPRRVVAPAAPALPVGSTTDTGSRPTGG